MTNQQDALCMAIVDDALAKVSELGTIGAMKWLAAALVAPLPKDAQDERKAFDKWHIKYGKGFVVYSMFNSHEQSIAWRAWQARAALSASMPNNTLVVSKVASSGGKFDDERRGFEESINGHVMQKRFLAITPKGEYAHPGIQASYKSFCNGVAWARAAISVPPVSQEERERLVKLFYDTKRPGDPSDDQTIDLVCRVVRVALALSVRPVASEAAVSQESEVSEFDDCSASPTGKHSNTWYVNGDCEHCKTGAQPNAPLMYTGCVPDTTGRGQEDVRKEAYRAGLEEAAKVCDGLIWALDHGGNKYRRPEDAETCAAAIRSLQAQGEKDE